jgi:hypothetical protein
MNAMTKIPLARIPLNADETAWERAKRQQTPEHELGALLSDIKESRKRTAHYANTKRWFRAHPAVASIPDSENGLLKRHEAQLGYTIHRLSHSRECKRIGELRRMLDEPAYQFALAAE